MPQFTSLFQNIVKQESIDALVVVGAQVVMGALADPQTPAAVIKWIAKYAKNEGEIREACKTYALFIATDSSLLALQGDFSQAGEQNMPTLAEVATVMIAKLTAWATSTENV